MMVPQSTNFFNYTSRQFNFTSVSDGKVLADDESYLAELKESCSAKATAWSIRRKLR